VVRVPCYRARGPGFDFRHCHIFWEVGLKRGPLSLVSTIENLLGRNNSGSGLESREYYSGDPTRQPISAKVGTMTTSGGRSVGIVRWLTKTTEFLYESRGLENRLHEKWIEEGGELGTDRRKARQAGSRELARASICGCGGPRLRNEYRPSSLGAWASDCLWPAQLLLEQTINLHPVQKSRTDGSLHPLPHTSSLHIAQLLAVKQRDNFTSKGVTVVNLPAQEVWSTKWMPPLRRHFADL
jgi:hypothetical protein